VETSCRGLQRGEGRLAVTDEEDEQLRSRGCKRQQVALLSGLA